jgi:hypothetical protein
LKELNEEGWVRSIVINKKEITLFPINKENKEVEVRPLYSKKTLNILSEIWDKEVRI